MDSHIAYLDESGGHGFDFSKSGTSKYFVVTAIIVESTNVGGLIHSFTSLKNKYYPYSELKSSKIGGKENLRLHVLNRLKDIDFTYYYLLVDKTKIHTDSGLQYKESFYKFIYGILYNNLYRTFRHLSVVADEMISNEFVVSFEKYITENHKADLFHQSKVTFSRSDQTILLQLADVIGGSMNRFYSGKSEINPIEILKDKCIGNINWPEGYIPYTIDEESSTDEFAEEISNLALLRIDDYIDRNTKSSDHSTKLRVVFLAYLRSVFLYNSKSSYIYTHEIIRHIKLSTSEDLKDQTIRQHIIGPLRSEGILIASNTNGYKIPSSTKDVISFFNLFSKIINPMVSRLQKSHEALHTATQGRLNMLEHPEFKFLKKLMDK